MEATNTTHTAAFILYKFLKWNCKNFSAKVVVMPRLTEFFQRSKKKRRIRGKVPARAAAVSILRTFTTIDLVLGNMPLIASTT